MTSGVTVAGCSVAGAEAHPLSSRTKVRINVFDFMVDLQFAIDVSFAMWIVWRK
jgi:hypothetical protein